MSAPLLQPGQLLAPPPYQRLPATPGDPGWHPYTWAGQPIGVNADQLPFWPPGSIQAGNPLWAPRAIAYYNLNMSGLDAPTQAYIAAKNIQLCNAVVFPIDGFLGWTSPVMSYVTLNRITDSLGTISQITSGQCNTDWFRGGQVLHLVNITGLSTRSYFDEYTQYPAPITILFKTDSAQVAADQTLVSQSLGGYAKVKLIYFFIDHPSFHGPGGFGDYVLAGLSGVVTGTDTQLVVLSGSDADATTGAPILAAAPSLITSFFGP